MSIAFTTKENYKNIVNSNLYDYIIITEDNTEFDESFSGELQEVINKYSPDIIYSDYSIIHDSYEERIYGKTIIFNEMKSKPNFIKNAAIKLSVVRKFGIEIDAIVRPENNLLIWHIPKTLFKMKGK